MTLRALLKQRVLDAVDVLSPTQEMETVGVGAVGLSGGRVLAVGDELLRSFTDDAVEVDRSSSRSKLIPKEGSLTSADQKGKQQTRKIPPSDMCSWRFSLELG